VVRNETADKRRWILGGHWGDPIPLRRAEQLRPKIERPPTAAARYNDGKPMPDRLLARGPTRDHRTAKAVTDEVFDVPRQMAYEGAPLNARVESQDTSRPDYVREKIMFDAGYETAGCRCSVPSKNATPPYQVVVPSGRPIGPDRVRTRK
jgi:hypothetical protein